MDIMGILRLVAIIGALFMLYSIASAPGIEGKLFALIIIALIAFYYFRKDAQSRIVNPVTKYYQNLFDLCKLNRAPKLRYLVMVGDKNNQAMVKGLITGGPLARKNKDLLYRTEEIIETMKDDKGRVMKDKNGKPIPAIDPVTNTPITTTIKVYDKIKTKDGEIFDPRADSYIFSYTNEISGFKTWFPFNLLFPRKEFLVCLYKNQLEEQSIFGDIRVKGVSTTFVGLMEFVQDWSLDEDVEMAMLNREVERLTLVDNLSMLPTRIRNAVDANSIHLKNIDLKDDLIPPSR